MIKEIKFKAKKISTGEWIESMTVAKGTVKRKRDNYYFEISANNWTAVDSKTIRQYTGLKSSDGGCNLPIKEAYIGDIVRFFNTDGQEIIAEIIWYKQDECIGFKRLSDGFVLTQRMFNESGYFQPSKINFEIIGNVYDNPELVSISI